MEGEVVCMESEWLKRTSLLRIMRMYNMVEMKRKLAIIIMSEK